MLKNNITLLELESHVVDINQPQLIPREVIHFFRQWKENKGGMPLGISHVPEKGWYIISPALQGKGIIRYFPD